VRLRTILTGPLFGVPSVLDVNKISPLIRIGADSRLLLIPHLHAFKRFALGISTLYGVSKHFTVGANNGMPCLDYFAVFRVRRIVGTGTSFSLGSDR
jgi:hypothetical protein